jgi:hypothetical protein
MVAKNVIGWYAARIVAANIVQFQLPVDPVRKISELDDEIRSTILCALKYPIKVFRLAVRSYAGIIVDIRKYAEFQSPSRLALCG